MFKTSEKRDIDIITEKLLTADVYNKTETSSLRRFINEAKDIEITLDFITYGNNLIKKILSKVLPKI